MQRKFYALPLDFDSVFDETAPGLAACGELESVDRHIELLLATRPGEHKFDGNFGCGIWDMDFERIVSRKRWEEDFAACILKAVRSFERRLTDIAVSVGVAEVVAEDPATKTTAVKNKVRVFIDGRLASSGEACGFNYALYLGPLSTE